ncbi:MAG: MiaB/RimO family radical SAM methylthiotransferase [Clostridiaceae bacterium]|nr:MiaB/RimO family radical SAM methylthiotransferase [Clostridiaceae bacterium]
MNKTHRDRVALLALGCKTNQYEMDALAESLRTMSFEIVEPDEDADAYVLNTCTVTAEAERKGRQLLRRWRREHPDALLVACGCYAERSDLSAWADVMIGTTGRSSLPWLLLQALLEKRENRAIRGTQCLNQAVDRHRIVQPKATVDFDVYEELGAVAVPKGVRAFLKIQDGCDHRCTYCAIAPARGPARSRGLEEIVQEARELVNRGYREINLTGTNINLYGIGSVDLAKDREAFIAHDDDLIEKRTKRMKPFEGRGALSAVSSNVAKGTCLTEVLDALERVDGLERIRLGSLDPVILTPEMMKQLALYNKLCPHFHLSLQSGSDKILRKMGRISTQQDYVDVCQRLYDAFPDAGITADIMVGFPGETEEDFQETVKLCEKVRFLRMHVFPYSRRQGTPADKWRCQVARDVVKDRAERLRALASRLAREAIMARVGRERDVLVENVDSEGRLCGYTPEYIYVRSQYIPDRQTGVRNRQGNPCGNLPGDIVRMRIVGAEGKDARAIVVK